MIFEKNFTILHTIPDWIDLKKIKKFTLDCYNYGVFLFLIDLWNFGDDNSTKTSYLKSKGS